VAARLGISEWDDDVAEVQAKAYCTDVAELIYALRPRVDEWITAGRLRRGVVLAVAAQAVQRAIFSAATGGIPLVGESHPEHSVQFNQASKAGVYLSADDLTLITPPPVDETGTRGKAFSIIPS
jgi:hypothetical protein